MELSPFFCQISTHCVGTGGREGGGSWNTKTLRPANQKDGKEAPLHRNGRVLRRAAHGITSPRRAPCPPRRASEAPRRDFFYQRRKSRATMKSKLAQFGKRIYARRHGCSSFPLIFVFHGPLWLGIFLSMSTVADFMKGIPSWGCHDRRLPWSIPPLLCFRFLISPGDLFFSYSHRLRGGGRGWGSAIF